MTTNHINLAIVLDWNAVSESIAHVGGCNFVIRWIIPKLRDFLHFDLIDAHEVVDSSNNVNFVFEWDCH